MPKQMIYHCMKTLKVRMAANCRCGIGLTRIGLLLATNCKTGAP